MIQCRLRELMAWRGRESRRKITYEVIRAETGISKSTLAKLANDKAQFVSLKVLEQLCTFFKCQPSDLLIYVDDSNQS